MQEGLELRFDVMVFAANLATDAVYLDAASS
jgi:hypothetical protein